MKVNGVDLNKNGNKNGFLIPIGTKPQGTSYFFLKKKKKKKKVMRVSPHTGLKMCSYQMNQDGNANLFEWL